MRISDWSSDVCSSDLPRSEWDRLDTGQRRLVESFIEGFNALGQGLAVERLSFHRDKQAVLAVRLDQSADQPILRLNDTSDTEQIGRASCRERVCQYV